MGDKRVYFGCKDEFWTDQKVLCSVVRYQNTVNICKAIKPVLYNKKRKLKMPRNFILLNALGPSNSS